MNQLMTTKLLRDPHISQTMEGRGLSSCQKGIAESHQVSSVWGPEHQMTKEIKKIS